jgi:hypothetical protein
MGFRKEHLQVWHCYRGANWPDDSGSTTSNGDTDTDTDSDTDTYAGSRHTSNAGTHH